MYITGAKGAAARKIREEEGGTEHVEENVPQVDEGERKLGKVKVCSFLTQFMLSMACDVPSDPQRYMHTMLHPTQ